MSEAELSHSEWKNTSTGKIYCFFKLKPGYDKSGMAGTYKAVHEYTLAGYKKPTCTDDGLKTKICVRCSAIKKTTLPATGHKYASWKVKRAATEIKEGLKERTCKKCEYIQKKAIPLLDPTLPSVRILTPSTEAGSITVKWKKLSSANLKKIKKIQIQYSKDKTFTKGVRTKSASAKTTAFAVAGLKPGTRYYVRIRAFTKTNKEVHVSKWSKVRSIIVAE